MKKIFLCSALGLMGFGAIAQQNYWIPNTAKTEYPSFNVRIDAQQLQQQLAAAGTAKESGVSFSLPTPDGGKMDFILWKNDLLPNDLQQRYPNILSFTATSLRNPGVSAKIEFTELGFHAMVFDGSKTFFINPENLSQNSYAVFYKTDYKRSSQQVMACGYDGSAALRATLPTAQAQTGGQTALRTRGTTRKTYRLALSCTGEYAVAVAGANATKAAVFSAMVTTINRVNGIYERELAVSLQFTPKQDSLIYTNPATDPFTANNNGDTLLIQNQNNTTSRIGSSSYDLGHIFSTGGGGIAYLGSICRPNFKAQGVTGSPNPVGDPYDVDYVCHEMGHQLGAEHTFNLCDGTNEVEAVALEPGSGATIMAYAGVCAPVNNLQPNSDAYFHNASLRQIYNVIESYSIATCGTAATGISLPTFTVTMPTYNIPKKTPFEFEFPEGVPGNTGSALTYCIEQNDLGNFQQAENLGGKFRYGPTFRSFMPDTVRKRVFPKMATILSGNLEARGERLSDSARAYNFIYTLREVKDGWGAVNSGDAATTINVVATPRRFSVLYPNANDSIIKNSQTTVYWDQAYTGSAPINCSGVDIYLSTDGGQTFPLVLAQNAPNTGSAVLQIPDIATNQGRIKIKANNNIFFSISKTNVVIGTKASAVKPFDTTTPPSTSLRQLDVNNAISIYPNPASQYITIALNANAKAGNVLLYNSIGQLLWREKITLQASKKSIPVSGYSKGVYFVRYINEDGGTFTKSVVVE